MRDPSDQAESRSTIADQIHNTLAHMCSVMLVSPDTRFAYRPGMYADGVLGSVLEEAQR